MKGGNYISYSLEEINGPNIGNHKIWHSFSDICAIKLRNKL